MILKAIRAGIGWVWLARLSRSRKHLSDHLLLNKWIVKKAKSTSAELENENDAPGKLYYEDPGIQTLSDNDIVAEVIGEAGDFSSDIDGVH